MGEYLSKSESSPGRARAESHPAHAEETAEGSHKSKEDACNRDSPPPVNIECQTPSTTDACPSHTASTPPAGESRPMDLIPVVAGMHFLSSEAQNAISKNPAGVFTGKRVFRGMLTEGKVKMYKQKMTGMDMQTLKAHYKTWMGFKYK